MNVLKATAAYERWLGQQIPLLPADLKQKHSLMAEGIFPFLRATFYRWVQLWPEVCAGCANAPKVLAVGDLHVENFGTWRDIEGRLVWGINDFDEACPMPYTLDLVRLATSAHYAIDGAHLVINHKDACSAILQGYSEAMKGGGEPWVLAERHGWLRSMVTGVLRDPERFWAKLDGLPTLKSPAPAGARRAIEKMLPAARLNYRLVHRMAGLGSLGRERYLAIADYAGGRVAREAKALAPSACIFGEASRGSTRLWYETIMAKAVRCPDHFVHLNGRWIVRRLAPDCSRVELASIPQQRDEFRLLYAMGFETANVHLGTKKAAKVISRDLAGRPATWLHEATRLMAKATTKDWEEWCASMQAPPSVNTKKHGRKADLRK